MPRPHARVALTLAPAVLPVAFLFVGGLAFAALQSFGLFAPAGESTLTLRHYRAALTHPEFLPSLALTLRVSLLSTALSAIAALALALALREAIRRTPALRVLLQVPVAVPHLAMAVAVVQLIAPSGLIARLLYALGLVHSPADVPALINDRLGLGIVLVYILKETPFLALLVLAVLLRVSDDYDALARTLGATRWQRLRHVTLPLVLPVLAAGSAVVFAFVFSAFEVPYLLGRPYPAMLGVVAQRRFVGVDLTERPEAIAVAMIAAAITTVAIGIGYALQRRGAGWGIGQRGSRPA